MFCQLTSKTSKNAAGTGYTHPLIGLPATAWSDTRGGSIDSFVSNGLSESN